MSVTKLSSCEPSKLPITTDVVLFTVQDHGLRVLLVDGADKKVRLPGGFAGYDEDLDLAALRHLYDQVGISGVYLEQLYTFGRRDRNPQTRVVSVAYYSLVPDSTAIGKNADTDCEDGTCWCHVQELPDMLLDHQEIIKVAHERLAAKLEYSTIALQLMPGAFTLSELQKVYEAIVGQALDKRNFRKRILSQGCVEETGGLARQGRHRPARLFKMRAPGGVLFVK